MCKKRHDNVNCPPKKLDTTFGGNFLWRIDKEENVITVRNSKKECRIEEGHIRPDHVHMMISIPPKHKVSAAIVFIKGKSAIWIARHCDARVRNFPGQAFRARVYIISSTDGSDEKLIREYIRKQNEQDRREEGQIKPLALPVVSDFSPIGDYQENLYNDCYFFLQL